ncbi:MAG: DUF4124 domain-containing protein [Rhodanobacter sp.]|jgi:hypothetical protein
MHRSLIALALLLLAAQVNAQVYKWTDASGTTHYSEAPPAKGTKFDKVTTTGTVEPLEKPAAKAANTEGATESSVAQKPVADTPENRSKLCESLKTNLTTLQGTAAVVMQQGGKTVALDDAQRKQQTDAAQAQYNQYCQGK